MKEKLAVLAVLLVVWPVAPVSRSESMVVVRPAETAQVTIYRDEWGVPHIYGPTDASVVFAGDLADFREYVE